MTLREFEGLVTCGRLVRFVNYCVRPSHLAYQADELLQRKFGRLYLVMPLIRCVWNERAYLQRDGVEAGNARAGASSFNPARFSEILKQNMFFAYFDMVLKLSDAIEQLAQWGESCPCHEDLQLRPDLRSFTKRGRHQAQTHFRPEGAKGHIHVPRPCRLV